MKNIKFLLIITGFISSTVVGSEGPKRPNNRIKKVLSSESMLNNSTISSTVATKLDTALKFLEVKSSRERSASPYLPSSK